MSSTSSSSTSPTTPRSRPVSLASGLGRQRSLRLPKKPVDAPIPPSLTSSKYLTSPHSIFRRTLSDPHIPSQEDEEWLRDTVPLSREGTDDVLTQEEEKKRSRLSGIIIMVRRTDDIDEALRGRSSERTKALRTATLPCPHLLSSGSAYQNLAHHRVPPTGSKRTLI